MAGRHAARYLRTLLSQIAVTVALVLLAQLTAGSDSALALLYGAACALLPQLFFALRMQAATNAGAARAARLGMLAESGKFLIAAAAFALVFAVLEPARPGLVFAGFGLLWVVQVFEGVRLLRQRDTGGKQGFH